jgi:hypothetical protein
VLELTAVDLGDLAQALEDHSYEHSWWLDPKTGEVVLWSDYVEELGEPDPEERGLLPIDPIPSHEGYEDMQDFIDRVRDPQARRRLERAIEGRGAFRRFKDTLLDFPELREAWFRFHDARIEQRAIEWLAREGLVDEEIAERAIAERPIQSCPSSLGHSTRTSSRARSHRTYAGCTATDCGRSCSSVLGRGVTHIPSRTSICS